jgi:hypothetical protein
MQWMVGEKNRTPHELAALSYTDRAVALTTFAAPDGTIHVLLRKSLTIEFKKRITMDTLLVIILLLLLFGGGGGLYWGMGAGWGIGPIGLIVVVLVVAFLLNGRRGRL